MDDIGQLIERALGSLGAASSLDEDEQKARALLLEVIARHRVLAHQILFQHRHPDVNSAEHERVIKEWHGPDLKRIFLAFRGFGKSTISEEAFIIRALFSEFNNGLILGENEARATERLEAIKHELEFNDFIEALFGPQKGSIWQAHKIVLPNGVCLQAVGSGQSLRGSKYLSHRPDCVLVDDVEGDGDTSTPEQREATKSWFMSVVIPALSPSTLIRMTATPLDEESLPLILSRGPSWLTTTIPIKFLNPATASWTATWPSRFPLSYIDGLEAEYSSTGSLAEFSREYMCQAVREEEKSFREHMFVHEPRTRSWEPIYIMYDPARTTNEKTSCHTGKAVWSWIGGKLIVWESGGYFWQPDQLVNDIFESCARYGPVILGVEKDGLDEFLLQPLRHKMAQEGLSLPLEAFKAPRGKLDFIKSLQPFFKAKEVVFVGDEHSEIKKQLLNFPRGRIDVPNALAYALVIRPGAPVYGEFGERHVVPNIIAKGQETLWAILNADDAEVSIQVVQYIGGRLKVIWDRVIQQPRGIAVPVLLKTTKLEFGRQLRGICPPRHFKSLDVLGLRPACKQAGLNLFQGGDCAKGEEELRLLLRTENGMQVGYKASWTLRTLAGGYCMSQENKKSTYKLIAEGLESFCGRLALLQNDSEAGINYGHTAEGQRYITSRPR